MLECLNFALLVRYDLHVGTGVFESLNRLGQFDLLDAVGGKHRDGAAFQFSCHNGLP
jgi:hypothetical protein